MNSREFALGLLNADEEEDVTDIIEKIEDEWDYYWKPHGTERNYSIVHSQAADSISSFAEPVVNSIDAVLTKKYREKYGDTYQESHNLTTSKEAATRLFEGDFNEEIQIIADGDPSGNPNLIIRDTGEGQPRQHFENRFLQLAVGGQIKHEWPFTQGRFKMGGSAVLPFSGDKGYKLIVSAGFKEPGKWSWSIIRNNRHEGQYEYMTRGGHVPRFDGVVRGQKSGTFVKVYEYDLRRTSTITTGFRDLFDRVLIFPAVPIRITEKRDVRSKVTDLTTNGLGGRLEQPRSKRHIQIHKTFPHNFGEPFGVRDIEVVVFKDKKTINETEGLSKRTKDRFVGGRKHKDRAVFFLVNGQTHSHERASFISGRSRCNFRHTGEDSLVFLDLSDFADKDQHDRADFHDLFKPSRDRMTGTKLAEQLVDELEYALKNYQPLKDEEDRRRRQTASKKRDEKTESLLENLLERDPSYERYLLHGSRAKVAGLEEEGLEEDDYDAPFLPTELAVIPNRSKPDKTWDESKGPYGTGQALNRDRRIYLKLDAPNNYFSREDAQGTLELEPAGAFKQRSLNNGILTLTLQPLSDGDVGDIVDFQIKIHPSKNGVLQQSFRVKYSSPVEEEDGGGKSTEQKRVKKKGFPNMIEVYQNGNDETTWDDMDWDEEDPPVVEVHPYDEEMDIYINMDSAPHIHFVTRNDIADSYREEVADIWKMGIVVNSLAMYHELRMAVEGDGYELEEPANFVPIAMRGVAETMLDQVIDDDQLDYMKA